MADLNKVQKEVYNQLVRDNWINSEYAIDLCTLGLTEEAGEVAGLRKRELRNYTVDRVRTTHEHFVEELGDVLWYLTACCILYNTSLDEIWEYNVNKLNERYGGNNG